MNWLAQILALSLGLTLLPKATAILAKGSLFYGNGSGCAVNSVAVPSVSTEIHPVPSALHARSL